MSRCPSGGDGEARPRAHTGDRGCSLGARVQMGLRLPASPTRGPDCPGGGAPRAAVAGLGGQLSLCLHVCLRPRGSDSAGLPRLRTLLLARRNLSPCIQSPHHPEGICGRVQSGQRARSRQAPGTLCPLIPRAVDKPLPGWLRPRFSHFCGFFFFYTHTLYFIFTRDK